MLRGTPQHLEGSDVTGEEGLLRLAQEGDDAEAL
jgi:hypothetical protein